MRSVPRMLLWEMFHHNRWALVSAVFAGLVIPTMLFAALRQIGLIAFDDPSMITAHVVMIQLNAFVVGVALSAAQGRPSRLFTFPITVSSLVAWHLSLAMAATASETVAFTLLLNALFDLHWPIWGPAMFAALMVGALQSVMWLTEKSLWVLLSLTIAFGGLGIWFKSQYGAPFSMSTYFWRDVTVGDMAMMVLFAGLEYSVAVLAVARNRRGDPLGSLGLLAWFGQLLDRAPASVMRFNAPARAQQWMEWRRKGWLIPGTVTFGMLLGLCFWLIFIRDPNELMYGFVVGGGVLPLAAILIGPLMGSDPSGRDTCSDMAPFVATLPMTTSEMARITMRVGMQSVFAGWALWGIGFLATYLVFRINGMMIPDTLFANLAWWYFPFTLLAPCAIVAIGICIGLAGRAAMFIKLLGGGLMAGFVGLFVAKTVLPDELTMILARGGAMTIGTVLVVGTVGAFVTAYRRLQIGWPTVYVAASLWVGLVAMIVFDQIFRSPHPIAFQTLLLGLASIAVAPLAVAPLALAWNRTR